MKSLLRQTPSFAAIAALFSLAAPLFAGTGELTKSGSTWTGKVDGVTVYTGSDVVAASDACQARMGGGVINLRANASIGKNLGLWNDTTFNGNGYTISSNYNGGVIRARNGRNVGATNLVISGSPWYGMYFQTTAGQTFSSISGSGGILMRIDNCAGGSGSNFSGGSPTCTKSGSHGVETMGINTATLGTVTATDRTGGCGLLFNQTSGGTVTNVNATRCTPNGGYAGYRLANSNNNTLASGTVVSTSCGRGFFSLTGSANGTVHRLEASSCNDVGVWIQDCSQTKVESGWVKNTPSCWWVSGSGSYANVTCQ